MIGISQSEPKTALVKEVAQALQDGEFEIGTKIKRLAYGPAPGRLGVAPSALMPELATEVSQARRDWPSYQPASEAVFTMPRATPSILKKRRLGSPGIWQTLKNSFQTDWKWWLGGSILTIVVIAIVAGGGKK